MPRFVLIDHWLAGVGGHNYQYAVDVLRAAERNGYEPILATHRRFSAATPFAGDAVQPLFRYGSTSRHWLGPDGKCSNPTGIDGQRLAMPERSAPRGMVAWLATRFRHCRDAAWQRDRRRRIEGYARDCGTLFQRIGFRSGDVVFLPSLSEFDLLGLVRFLQACPASRAAHWHLQFHFDIFAGRAHEYPWQEDRLLRFRRQFQAALASASGHRLHLYATTEAIAAQYNQLGVGRFEALPYPISRAFGQPQQRQPQRRQAHGRLRVTCAGAVRREKGRVEITRLLCELWDDFFASGRLQLVIQTDRKALRRLLPRRLARRLARRPRPTTGTAPALAAWAKRLRILPRVPADCQWPVLPVAYPLAAAAYAELLRQADVGLFLYDPRRYYARCSGILVEMLAAGVPVIVPAGCWLADQIAEPTQAHLDTLIQAGPVLERHDQSSTAWRTTPRGLAARLVVPDRAADVVVRFRWDRGASQAGYAALSIIRSGDSSTGAQDPLLGTVVGHRGGGRYVSGLFHLQQQPGRVEVRLETAYENRPLAAVDVEVLYLGPLGAGRRRPAGSVGLVAESPARLPALLAEMIDQLPHYRATAAALADRWRTEHAADRTVERLAASTEPDGAVRAA